MAPEHHSNHCSRATLICLGENMVASERIPDFISKSKMWQNQILKYAQSFCVCRYGLCCVARVGLVHPDIINNLFCISHWIYWKKKNLLLLSLMRAGP